MAKVEAHRQLRMNAIEVYYGEVEDYDSSEIVISDGRTTTTYGGSFSYNYYGEVFGTLRSIVIDRFGNTLVDPPRSQASARMVDA